MFYTVYATPHNGMFAPVVPCNPAINISALRAVNNAGKCILAAINPFLAIFPAMQICPSEHFFLHLHINVTGNNRFVAVFHIILWNNTIIHNTLFGKDIHRISLLKKCITNVFLVFQDFFDGFRTPFGFPCCREYPIRLKTFSYLFQACTLQVFPVNAFYDFCFIRLNNKMPVFIFCISHETVVINLHLAILVTKLQS